MTKPVQITFRNMRASAALEDHVRARVEWLERFHPDLVGCRVRLEVPHRHHAHGQHVRVHRYRAGPQTRAGPPDHTRAFRRERIG